ncbi:MAG: HNH endonuclease [Sphingomonas sp.]|nr:HNH endonuclease [Sphingomonas sp.]
MDYDPETGGFRWKRRPRHHFACARGHNSWNARFAGKPCAKFRADQRYVHINLGRFLYKAHRLAWLIVHGEWPEEIDHISGVGTDNRLTNLRNVNHAENSRNRRLRSDNSTGVTGVYRRSARRWFAYIDLDGQRENIGYFDTIEEAVTARAAAAIKHGFHENHGLTAAERALRARQRALDLNTPVKRAEAA